MAPSLMRYETETTIDVSQGAQSSPINTEPNLHVEATPEIVEDSFKDISKGGPVQPPQHEETNESDELYSLSPRGKASHEKRKATNAKPRVVECNSPNVFSGIEEPLVAQTSPDPLARDECRTIVEPKLVTNFLEQGAKVSEAAVTTERSVRNQAVNGDTGMFNHTYLPS